MRKRPPQGTRSIVNLEKQKKTTERRGQNLLDAVETCCEDPMFKELSQAKADRNHKKMGELIPILREKYGEKAFVKMFKSL